MTDQLVLDDRITLWGLFLEVHEGINRRLIQELEAEVDLPGPWMEVLLRVARTPGQRAPMTQLARMVLFSSGGFTKLADRMEHAGLIRREPSPSDRRSTLVVLTDEGRDLLARAVAVHVPGIQRHLIDHIDASQREQLESILRTLRAGLESESVKVTPTLAGRDPQT